MKYFHVLRDTKSTNHHARWIIVRKVDTFLDGVEIFERVRGEPRFWHVDQAHDRATELEQQLNEQTVT